MTAAGYDYVILHPGRCGCVSDGWVRDSMYEDQMCGHCDGSLGLKVPITVEEGRLWAHLSCVFERNGE
jgi:hypothetical protein